MRILVTFAVEAEFAPWRKLRQFKTRSIGDICVFEAQVGRAGVDFVVTGMGIENSSRVTKAVLTNDHQFCISSGFAGALRPQHKIVSNAQQDGASRVKLLLTSDHVVRTAAEKAQLAPFADCVDMESFGVLSAAQQHGRPAVAIRVISDKYDGEIPADVELTMNQRGRVQIRRVVRYLSKHPIHLPALMRLGRDSRTAAGALCVFLEAYIKKTSFFTHGWFPEGEGLEEVAVR